MAAQLRQQFERASQSEGSVVVDDQLASAGSVPDHVADQHFSAESCLRIPREVHRALAIEAAEQGVSFSRLVSPKVAS
jgi:predicted HicB family RNase H-like nuclease